MNPKIMKRPMFRMGGSARPGYQDSNYADLVKQIRKDLADRTARRDEYLRGVKSVLPLSVLSQASGLGQIRKPADVINLLSEIGTNPATFAALMKSKSIDMKMDEGALKDKLALAKLIKPNTKMSTLRDVVNLSNELSAKIREAEQKGQDTTLLEKQLAKVLSQNTDLEQRIEIMGLLDEDERMSKSALRRVYETLNIPVPKDLTGNAMGGIPNRRMNFQQGTPNPEFTMPEPKPREAVQDRQLDTLMKAAPALEDPNQARSMSEGDMYAALRRRLPQEITDDVVRLIAYNPEAFADFADIQDQSDVDSFNQKYNVQLVLPVENVT
jgi:hypothetical protein